MRENELPGNVLFQFIEGIREDKKFIQSRGEDYEIRADGVYYEGAKFYSKEGLREAWSSLGAMGRLRSASIPLDIAVPSDIIIFRPIESEAFIKSKLLLPDQAKRGEKGLGEVYKEMPFQGIVVAAGPGFMTDSGLYRPVGCEVGDHIILRVGSGLVSDFLFMGALYYQTRSSDLVGVGGVEYGSYLEDSYNLSFAKIR